MENIYKKFILEGKILKKIYQVYSIEEDLKNLDEDILIFINNSLEDILEKITSIINVYNQEFNKNIDYKLYLDPDTNILEKNIIFNLKIESILIVKIKFKEKDNVIFNLDVEDDSFLDFISTVNIKNKELIISSLKGTDKSVNFCHALSILMGTSNV